MTKKFKIILIILLILITISNSLLFYLYNFNPLNQFKTNEYQRNIVAKYNLLKPSSEYLFLITAIKKIEKSLRIQLIRANSSYAIKKRLTQKEFEDYASLLYTYKQLYNIDLYAFISNTVAESFFNKKAYSSKGAIGLNQIMPRTYLWIQYHVLFHFKVKKSSIYNVYKNTETALMYWYYNTQLLSKDLDRPPTIKELAYAYNLGGNATIQAIKSKKLYDYLPRETIKHGEKVLYYYTNYKNNNFNAFYNDSNFKITNK